MELSLDKYRDLMRNKDKSGIQTFNENLPKGILLSFKLAEDDGGSFQDKIVKFSSEYVYDYVIQKCMKDLWQDIVPNGGTFDSYLFEKYCMKTLVGKANYSNVRLVQGKRIKKANDGDNQQNLPTNQKMFGGCTQEDAVDDIIASAIHTENTVFYPLSKTNKFIDFMYRNGTTYNMFQATIGKSHSSNVKDLYEIVKSIYEKDPKLFKNISGIRNQADVLPSFNIYYMVPNQRFDYFTTSPVDPKRGALDEFKEHEKNQCCT
jgi:hypothetical protein